MFLVYEMKDLSVFMHCNGVNFVLVGDLYLLGMGGKGNSVGSGRG